MHNIKIKRIISYRTWDHRHGPIPSLNITGLYLRKLGFPFHQQVHLAYEPGRITITTKEHKKLLARQGEQINGE